MIAILKLLVRLVGAVVALFGLGLVCFGVVAVAAGLGGLPLGQVWFEHDPFRWVMDVPSIQLVQVFFERKLNYPPLWNPTVVTVLGWPAWVGLAVTGLGALVIGLALLALGRRRRTRAFTNEV